MDQLTQAVFTFGHTGASVKILADDDIGGGLRPALGHLNVALFKDDFALFVGDGCRTLLPFQSVVGCLARFQIGSEVARESETLAGFRT